MYNYPIYAKLNSSLVTLIIKFIEDRKGIVYVSSMPHYEVGTMGDWLSLETSNNWNIITNPLEIKALELSVNLKENE